MRRTRALLLVIAGLASGSAVAGGPICGDGFVNQPGETCDPPGVPAGALNECRDDCTFCGDGLLDTDFEACDDGDNTSGAGCDGDCSIPIWVAVTGSDAMGDGSSSNPYQTISHAVLQAGDHYKVIVRPGNYNECVDAAGKPIRIEAEAWTTQQDNTATTIDGLGVCDPTRPFSEQSATVRLASSVSSIEGFTITGGAASGVNARGSVTITNNVITGNTGVFGGGVYVYSAVYYYGEMEAVISDNLITGNLARWGVPPGLGIGYRLGGYGGGVFVYGLGSGGEGATITVSDNTVSNNTVNEDSADPDVFVYGAGIGVSTNTSPNSAVEVVVSNNLITGNSAVPGATAYSGGVSLYTYGYGSETIRFVDNVVANNSANLDGGGVSAWVTTYGTIGDGYPGTADSDTQHRIELTGNSIVNNDANGNGGGLDLFLFARDLKDSESATIYAADNDVVGNVARGGFGGGGGIAVNLRSWRSDVADQGVFIESNNVLNNDSQQMGGGIGMVLEADSDPPDDGRFPPRAPAHADATVVTRGNLIASNAASDAGGVGGGLFVFLQSFVDADARVVVDQSTIADNQTSSSGGGVHIETFIDFDNPPGSSAFGYVDVENSIVSENEGIGIGGPIPGSEPGVLAPPNSSGNLELRIAYTDTFGNGAGDYDSWIDDPTGTDGNISQDPLLTDLLYEPLPCSPSIDAADPTLGFSLEPSPNGARANQGHTGGTADATTSFPDQTGDGFIDGIDILRLSVAFGSTTSDPRYDLLADVDGNGVVDGVDLAAVATEFGRFCETGSR